MGYGRVGAIFIFARPFPGKGDRVPHGKRPNRSCASEACMSGRISALLLFRKKMHTANQAAAHGREAAPLAHSARLSPARPSSVIDRKPPIHEPAAANST